MRKVIGAIAAALSLGACVTDPPPYYLVAPADPFLTAPRIRVSAVTAGVKTFRVTAPGNWQELNRRVGAGAGGAGMGGMDHSNMPGMKMGNGKPSKTPETTMPGMDHSNMPGMK